MPLSNNTKSGDSGESREEAIIQFLLNEKDFFSGEQMAQRLRISRTAVWNHIRHLKGLGFGIESQPHLGYRLVEIPDIMLPALVAEGLKTRVIGKKIFHFGLTSSSSDEAEKMARGGAEEGTVVIADGQTAGRGRMGRVWHSPQKKGIYLSVLLRPSISPARIPFLTLCAAVSATEAIRRSTGLKAFVKWPNDVLLSERKVSGILTQLSTEADRIDYAIVGIGINVNHTRDDFPAGIEATSLRIETGHRVSRLAVARTFLQALDSNYALLVSERDGDIIDRWLKLSATVGRRVRAENLSGEKWEGIATGLDASGCLLLRLDNGLTQRLTGGDLTII